MLQSQTRSAAQPGLPVARGTLPGRSRHDDGGDDRGRHGRDCHGYRGRRDRDDDGTDSRDDSLLNGFTRRRWVCRWGEGTQVDGRRTVAAQTMIQYQQLRITQALGQLGQVLLQQKRLACLGIGLTFSTEAQVCTLCAGQNLAGGGTGLITRHAGIELRLIGLVAGRAAFAGDQRLCTDLRSLNSMIGVGSTGGRVDGFNHRGEQFDAAVQTLQVGLHGLADVIGQAAALFAEQFIQRARSKIMHQHPAGRAANQGRNVSAVIGRRHGCGICQANAIDESHVHVDDLKALLVAGTAGNDLGLFVDMAGIPQTVGAARWRAFGRVQRLLEGVGGRNAGRQLMNHAVFNRQHAPERPGHTHMQTGTEYIDRLAEALINAPPLHGDFMHAAQHPAQRCDHRQHWQKGATHVGKGPDLAQIDAETVVQFVLQGEQRARRPAQQVSDETGGQQARFATWVARAEHRQHSAQQELQRHAKRQQADQHRQPRRPDTLCTGEEQAQRANQQDDERHAHQLRQRSGLRRLTVGLAAQLSLYDQQPERQQQHNAAGQATGGGEVGTGQRQVPEGANDDQRQHRPTGKPQGRAAHVPDQRFAGVTQPFKQALVPTALVASREVFVERICIRQTQRASPPQRDMPRRLQARCEQKQRRRGVAQHRHPQRARGKQIDGQRQQQPERSCPTGHIHQSSQTPNLLHRHLKTRQAFKAFVLIQINPHHYPGTRLFIALWRALHWHLNASES
ncbi:Uncharacterized protein ALO39_05542 [Pseudomonas syringae pv. lapsa]|nr:Uncharacterized protein ALO39_05542 [Pseudomonas syringae pv. lapsa]